MKKLYLDAHSSICSRNYNNQFDDFCDNNPCHEILFVKNEFIHLRYNHCIAYNEIDFIENVVNRVLSSNKIYDMWRVNRSVNVKKDLQNYINHDKPLRRYVREVNYLYSDAAHREYAITTTTNYIGNLCTEDELKNEYLVAMDIIGKIENNEYLLHKLKYLFLINLQYMANVDEYLICRTIEKLVQTINNKQNGQEKSKHQRVNASCV